MSFNLCNRWVIHNGNAIMLKRDCFQRLTTKGKMTCRVSVSEGTLEGKICSTYYGKQYYSFEGIPYARPPLGDLRFKAPQKPENWTGIKDAKKPGNKCAQLNPFGTGILEGCEDCLYLNVYTPSLPMDKMEKLPVIFFVHGGRLVVGYGDYYKPDYLLRNDVILVTINYRLNIFGFLCLEIPEVPGNAGLKDTVMALKWVKQNICQFNGDANNITAMGESAGAAIVTTYLTSKMAEGLCNKIICQSGVSIAELYIIPEDSIKRASTIASYLDQNTTDKNELYKLFQKTSTEDLINAFVSAELNRPPAIINAFLLPVVEKKFDGVEQCIHEAPYIMLRQNRFEKIPIIVTLNSFESALFLNKDENGEIIFEENLQYYIPRYLNIAHETPKAVQFAGKIHNYYFKGKKINKMFKNEFLNLTTDHYFSRDIILFMEIISQYHKDIYLCRFDYNGKISTSTIKKLGLEGASHGDLIQYIFYRENKLKVATENDLKIVDILIEAWCNFAKTSQPYWKNQKTKWLPYNKAEKLCLNIDNRDIAVKDFPNFERINFWFDLIVSRAKL